MEGGTGIPPTPSAAHRSHLDTHYLLALLLGEEFDRIAYNAAHALTVTPRQVAVSLVAVGEAFTSIATGHASTASLSVPPSDRFYRLVRDERLAICWGDCHRPGSNILKLAGEVRQRVPGIGPADYLIVATALACRWCGNLYTTDGPMLVSTALRAFCSTGGRHLQLSEAPPPHRRAR